MLVWVIEANFIHVVFGCFRKHFVVFLCLVGYQELFERVMFNVEHHGRASHASLCNWSIFNNLATQQGWIWVCSDPFISIPGSQKTEYFFSARAKIFVNEPAGQFPNNFFRFKYLDCWHFWQQLPDPWRRVVERFKRGVWVSLGSQQLLLRRD